ncbi:MAG: flagellar biosynthesis protein FliQ [Oscillospiraceae bacterium]|nr:flagellar biosynthesis protein FliQ [Oscillospiraceae bacterium]
MMVDEGVVMNLFSDAMRTALMLVAPVLIVSVSVGLIIAIIQAATQVHEQTLTFAPKLIMIALALLLMGPWMIGTMRDFINEIFQTISNYA